MEVKTESGIKKGQIKRHMTADKKADVKREIKNGTREKSTPSAAICIITHRPPKEQTAAMNGRR